MSHSGSETEIIDSDEFLRYLDRDAFARLIPLNEVARSALSWFQRRTEMLSKSPLTKELDEDDAQFLKKTAHHALL